MADISLPLRNSLSDISWGGDNSYPITRGCYGTCSTVFQSTS